MSRQTVLVVDDEASIADGLRLTLESEGLKSWLARFRLRPVKGLPWMELR